MYYVIIIKQGTYYNYKKLLIIYAKNEIYNNHKVILYFYYSYTSQYKMLSITTLQQEADQCINNKNK